MLGEEVSSSLLVEIGGSPLPADAAGRMVSAFVDDSVNVPDMFVLRFTDPHADVLSSASITIGAAVKLSVQTSAQNGPAVLMTGEVTALDLEVDSEGTCTVVRGLDKSHRLMRGTRVEAYVQMTAGDVAKKVAQRAGLGVGKVDAAGSVMEQCSQNGISDWEFLRRLASEVGAEVAVIDGALDFRMPTRAVDAPAGQDGSRHDALVLEHGVNLLSLHATVTSAEQVSEVEVRGWDVANKQVLSDVEPAHASNASGQGVDPAGLAGHFGGHRRVETVSAYRTASQCRAAAKAVVDRVAAGFAELEGVVRGNPTMHAGTAVALVKVGTPFEGRYTLSSTRHEFTGHGGYTTSFTVANTSERSLYGVATGGAGTPPPLSGVLVGAVSDVRDPDRLGRVKVAFPVLSDSYVSWWARTVQVGAGRRRGAMVLPEVGDEVLVAFGMGDFAEPYVIGGLYNGKDEPGPGWADAVDATDGSVARRSFTSRSGLVVEMVETARDEKLTLSTNSGDQRITLVQKANAAIEIVSQGPLTVTAKQDVTVSTDTGAVKLKGNTVSIEATSDLTLKGANLTAEAQASATFKGTTVQVSGSATAELSGNATTTVRGGIVKIN